jgi:hypothetical protein
MRKVFRLGVLASTCFLVACNVSAVPAEGPSLKGSGFEGREMACSAVSENKVFLDETRDLLGKPFGGFKLWRVGERTEKNNSYEISDKAGNCVLAFIDNLELDKKNDDGTPIVSSDPNLTHPYEIIATPPPKPIKVSGVEVRKFAAGPRAFSKKLSREYLDRCLMVGTIESCRARFYNAVAESSAWGSVTGGTLMFFDRKIYFNEVRIK